MFHYFLSLSTNGITIISAQNLKLKITRKLNCTFPLLFLCVNSVITECYFIVIMAYLIYLSIIYHLSIICVPVLSLYNKKFCNDGQKKYQYHNHGTYFNLYCPSKQLIGDMTYACTRVLMVSCYSMMIIRTLKKPVS